MKAGAVYRNDKQTDVDFYVIRVRDDIDEVIGWWVRRTDRALLGNKPDNVPLSKMNEFYEISKVEMKVTK